MLTKPLRPSDIRKRNEKVILRIIRENGVTSQGVVVQKTKLMASSVLSIFNELLRQELICEAEKDETPERPDQRGRKPKYFKIVSSAFYAFGIDLTPHFFHLSIVDFAGNQIADKQIEVDNNIKLQNLYKVIGDSILSMARAKRIPKKKFLGLGMGIPGQVDNENGICIKSPFFKELLNFPLSDDLGSYLKMPVYIHNNCSVITVSERKYRQNMDRYQSLMAVLLRTGVGGGFTAKDTHEYYNQVSAYEIGHIPYSLDGPICHCGARGCVETQLGEDVLRTELDRISPLKSITLIDDDYLANPEVQDLLHTKGSLLYMTIRSVYQSVFPDMILLISRSPALSSFLVDHLRLEADRDNLSKFTIQAEIYDPALYSLGASDLVWENYFHIKDGICA